MVENLIGVALTSLVSCLVGLLVSLIPLKRSMDKRFAKAESDAERRKEFDARRYALSRDAISSAGRAFFWLERGCKDHEPKHWNGELHQAIDEYKIVEEDLKQLDAEIIKAFNESNS